MEKLKPYENLLDTNPLLRLVIPMAVGIWAGDLCFEKIQDCTFVLGIAIFFSFVFCLGVFQSRGPHSRKYIPFFSVLGLGMMFMGMLLQVSALNDLRISWPEEKQELRVLLIDTPKEGEKVWNVTGEVLNGAFVGNKLRLGLLKEQKDKEGGKIVPFNDGRDSLVSDFRKLKAGDVVLMYAKVETPRNAGNPSEFDFAKWLKRQGVCGSVFCFSSEWKKSDYAREDLSIAVRALRWRDNLIEKYANFFEGRNLGIISAMTLGDKTFLDGQTRDLFSQTGVSHILALSGLHLGILFSLYQIAVAAFCRRRFVHVGMSLLGVAGIWGFALLAGLPLSLVRAAIMFSVVQIMVCFRRDSFSINNLALAALILLLFSPQSLFDVGFQLSFLSVFSILLFSDSFPRPAWVCRNIAVKWIYGLFAVSCCAQLGTAPLVAYYFHTFPVFGIFANFIAVPFAYLILGLSLAFFLLPFLQPTLAVVLGLSLQAMDRSLTALSNLPMSVVELYPSELGVWLFYLFVICFMTYWVKRKVMVLYTATGVLCLMVGVELYARRSNRLEAQLLVYNMRGLPAVHAIVSSDCSYLWSTDSAKVDSLLGSVKRTFWKKEGIMSPIFLDSTLNNQEIYYDENILLFNGSRVALCCGNLPKGKPEKPLSVDYLLIGRGAKGSLSRILNYFLPEVIVLDGGLTDFYYKKFKRESKDLRMEVYDIRKNGALSIK